MVLLALGVRARKRNNSRSHPRKAFVTALPDVPPIPEIDR
jgi:hypothetical protein